VHKNAGRLDSFIKALHFEVVSNFKGPFPWLPVMSSFVTAPSGKGVHAVLNDLDIDGPTEFGGATFN